MHPFSHPFISNCFIVFLFSQKNISEDQILDLQLDALHGQGVERIYQEHASGKNTARPELENCLKALREGDTLVVWRLDRLGRNLAVSAQRTHLDRSPAAAVRSQAN
jgi:DNA invertase Pin-like site-specific DNA recombinase